MGCNACVCRECMRLALCHSVRGPSSTLLLASPRDSGRTVLRIRPHRAPAAKETAGNDIRKRGCIAGAITVATRAGADGTRQFGIPQAPCRSTGGLQWRSFMGRTRGLVGQHLGYDTRVPRPTRTSLHQSRGFSRRLLGPHTRHCRAPRRVGQDASWLVSLGDVEHAAAGGRSEACSDSTSRGAGWRSG